MDEEDQQVLKAGDRVYDVFNFSKEEVAAALQQIKEAGALHSDFKEVMYILNNQSDISPLFRNMIFTFIVNGIKCRVLFSEDTSSWIARYRKVDSSTRCSRRETFLRRRKN